MKIASSDSVGEILSVAQFDGTCKYDENALSSSLIRDLQWLVKVHINFLSFKSLFVLLK